MWHTLHRWMHMKALFMTNRVMWTRILQCSSKFQLALRVHSVCVPLQSTWRAQAPGTGHYTEQLCVLGDAQSAVAHFHNLMWTCAVSFRRPASPSRKNILAASIFRYLNTETRFCSERMVHVHKIQGFISEEAIILRNASYTTYWRKVCSYMWQKLGRMANRKI